MSAQVLVTGASGYVAGHVVQQLQEAGYKVRGTVRSLKNTDKVKHLYHLCPDAAHKLELVEADLTNPESWPPAVGGVTYVIHVASPFPITQPKREEDLIVPAVEGTLSVLRACAKTSSVKRVVMTSSCAAVGWEVRHQDSQTRTEEDWSDTTRIDTYSKSKTLAEKAAWDFVHDLPDDEKFELVVINPSLVLGPPLHGTVCSSVDIMKKLLERQMPMLPKMSFAIIDVRDVALAHIKAMTTPEAAGQRFICNNTNLWFSQMAILLKTVFGSQGYNVPTSVAPKVVLWMGSIFDSSIKLVLPHVGDMKVFANNKLKTVLGVQPREVRDTVIEMAYALIENGFVKKTSKYRGPGGAEEREHYMAVQL